LQPKLHEEDELSPAPRSRVKAAARANSSQRAPADSAAGCSSRAWWEVMAQARAHRCEQRPHRDSVCSDVGT
jgi:hypothetical protein